MLRFYLNRELAERLKIPLNRWKRWSREFLPPDPLGGLQSGYARQYTLSDAFIVYLGGYLVSGVSFTIPEARNILQDLNGWLKKNVVERYAAAVAEGRLPPDMSAGIDLLVVPVQGGRGRPAFTYRIRCLEKCTMLAEGNPSLWQERYSLQCLKPAEPRTAEGYPNCIRWVDLAALAWQFFEAIYLHNANRYRSV